MSLLFDMLPQHRESVANMHRLNKSLIAAIYAAAKEQNVSQSEIAKRIETDKSVISRLLRGQGNPTIRTVSEICAALGLSPDWVFSQQAARSNSERFVKGGNGHSSTTFQPRNDHNKGLSMSKEAGRVEHNV